MAISEKEIGKKIYRTSIKGKKSGDRILDDLEKELNSLNEEASIRARAHYSRIFKSLALSDGNFVLNNLDNLSKVSELLAGLDPIISSYREKYGRIFRNNRLRVMGAISDREQKISEELQKIGVDENRNQINEESFSLISMISSNGLEKVNRSLLRWKDTVYDLFFDGVVKSLNILDFEKSFFNTTGTVKVGSSLEGVSVGSAITAMAEMRGEFLRRRAGDLGYDYCWNSNPMDRKTKPICLEASLAGVISENSMQSDYGFPPRYICRCELVYTRGEWTELNQAINEEIRGQSEELLDELNSLPGKAASWIWKGKTIFSTSPDVGKPYKEIEDKIKIVEDNYVPDFEE